MIFTYIVIGFFIIIALLVFVFKGKRNHLRMPLNKLPSSPFYGWNIEDLSDERDNEDFSLNLDDDMFIPWEDVFASKIVYKEFPEFDRDDTVVVEWSSSRDTWQNLCGRAGYVIISKSQKKQLKFILTVMN